MRRLELVQRLQAQNYEAEEIDSLLKKLHTSGILKCSVGRYADVYIA